METADKLDNYKEKFKFIFGKIKRSGAAELLEWLEHETDFFTAPTSTKYHGAHPGGLLIHSVNVWQRLHDIVDRDMMNQNAPDFCDTAEQAETIAILGLLHDVCKVGVYHKADPFKAVLENKLDPYTFRDPFPLGHGEKSLFLITRHMALTEEEALAIRWHMGAYDDAVKGGSRSMTEALNLTPWVWRLQEADMCATWIDERSAEERKSCCVNRVPKQGQDRETSCHAVRKITCAECGRRRFGVLYDVTGWAIRRKKGGHDQMSQRAKKYARHMERRVDKLEERADCNEQFIREGLYKFEYALEQITKIVDNHRADHANEVEAWRRVEIRAVQESRRQRREIERAMERQRVVLVIALVLAVVALIVAVNTMDTGREEEPAKTTTAVITGVEADLLATEPVESDPWEFVALYRSAAGTLEEERVAEALLAHGYFSVAVPLPFEYVGIFQLNQGPGGAYHAELEAATGLDHTTPEGNIAGGCYLLGKYLAQYEDTTKAAMAYNMGQAGAASAWEAGITSTSYTDAVLAAMEMWECTVNAWAGE